MNSTGPIGLTPDLIAEAVRWRRFLHQHPELAFNERKTADFIACHLTQFGFAVHRGFGGTGVVGTLVRGMSQRVVAIRADMDALPIQEQGNLAHGSHTPGIMHACGHDGHVAMALAAARVIARMPDLNGTVRFIFQPAEENEGGGRRMIEEGLFKAFPCDVIYALHNWPSLPIGACVARDGAMMAAMAVFEIVVSGRGCHGGMPHEGADPVLTGCQVVAALQSIASRNIDPLRAAVISATQISGGDTWNVIPDSCVIRGSTRWFDDDIGDLIERRIQQLTRLVAEANGCESTVRYDRRIPATINDPVAASIARSIAGESPMNLTIEDRLPSMGAEDFAFMLKEVAGCYLWLGTGSGNDHGLHSSRYDFNDEALPLGAALWITLVKKSLANS